MAKLTPQHVEGEHRLRGVTHDADWLMAVRSDLRQDRENMGTWLERHVRDYRRRYRYGPKSTDYPFQNASMFRTGLSDIAIEESKVAMLNMHFGRERLADMEPLDAVSAAHASNAGIAFDYLLRVQMTDAGVPDYYRQTSHSLDSVLQFGVGVDKQYYNFVTRTAREHIRFVDMPESLRRFVVVERPDPQQQIEFANNGIFILSRQEFDELGGEVEQIINFEYGLDPEDGVDRAATDQIMRFIRAGNPQSSVTVRMNQVLDDSPRTENVPLENLVVPVGTRHVQSAKRLRHDIWMTEEEILQRGNDNVWRDGSSKAILDGGNGADRRYASSTHGSQLWEAMRDRSATRGTGGQTTDKFKISELYCYKRNERGLPVPVVVTMHEASDTICKAIELPFAHQQWPFVDTRLEANESDYFSPRGIVRRAEDLENYANALHRSELNGLELQTAAMYKYRQDSPVNPSKHRPRPGMMIPVRRMDDFEPVNQNISALALERPKLEIQGLMERMVGSFNPASFQDARLLEPRTATETTLRAQNQQQTMGLRGALFNEGRERIFSQLWSLWQQYGPDDFYARAAGEEMRKLTQAQISGKFRIRPRGALADMDPNYRMGQALQALQILAQFGSAFANDPRYVPDAPMAVKRVLDLMDPHMSQALVRERTPEEQREFVAQLQQRAAQEQAVADEAQRLSQGAAVTPEGAAAVADAAARLSPNGDLQAIQESGAAAAAAAEQASVLGVN